jgi:diadenosine tetraphosphate (Ap4A) HIT family hydrolase
VSSECYPCVNNEQVDQLPPREFIHLEGGWRVAHAFNSTLPGWLVLVPMRHVTSMDELTAQESEEMGLLARKASIALREVTGCSKTYLMLFAEAEGFGHLHVHVVPRMPEFESDVLGPGVFAYLSDDQDEWLAEDERDAIGLQLRLAISTVR